MITPRIICYISLFLKNVTRIHEAHPPSVIVVSQKIDEDPGSIPGRGAAEVIIYIYIYVLSGVST